jgi:hypothetical protein
VLALQLLAGAPRLHAQAPAPAAASTPSTSTPSTPPDWHLDQCLGGLSYGAPFKLALAYGGGLIRESTTGGADLCAFVAGKVGFGAARASIGFGRSTGPLGGGAAVSAGLLRTFAGSWNATPRRNYVGASVHIWPLLGLGGEIGYYTRLGDAAGVTDAQRHVIAWSAGFGF